MCAKSRRDACFSQLLLLHARVCVYVCARACVFVRAWVIYLTCAQHTVDSINRAEDNATPDPAVEADAQLALEIEQQDAQALDILSRLPRRDDWHGDTGDDVGTPARQPIPVPSANGVAANTPSSSVVSPAVASVVSAEIQGAAPPSRLSEMRSSGSSTATGNNRALACARQGAGHLQRGELADARVGDNPHCLLSFQTLLAPLVS